MRIRARHYRTGEVTDVVCRGGVIAAAGPPGDTPPDAAAGWAAPALFDLQVNGCDGRAFSSEALTGDDVRHVVGVCRRHGIGALLPTLVTNSFAALRHGFETLRRACDGDPVLARALPGFHLEGPYISPLDGPRGAHPLGHVRPPDPEEFRRLQEAAGGRIRLVTLSPHWPGAPAFVAELVRSGVAVALGHTHATADQIAAAAAAGATLSTHLGNGAHAVLPRHDNYVWHQLADDRLHASLICDGRHLPPAVVKCMVRAKTPARIILTCDASSLAGLPPGRYREWGQEFEVLPGGEVVVPGTEYLAGSGQFLDACVGNVIRFAGVPLADAVEMATSHPRRLLGLPVPTLEPGQPADLVLFDWAEGGPLTVTAPVTGGELTWNR